MSNNFFNVLKEHRVRIVSYLVTYVIIFCDIAMQLSLSEGSSLFYYVAVVYLLLLLFYIYMVHRQVSPRSIWKFVLIYLCYMVSAGFIKASLNLANESFESTIRGDYLVYNGLVTFAIVYLGSLIYNACWGKRVGLHDSNETYELREKSDETILHGQLYTMAVMSGELLIDRFLTNTLLPITDLFLYESLFKLLQYSILYYVFYAVILTQFFKVLSNLKKNKVNFFSGLVTSVILAVLTNFFIQAGITEYWTWWSSYATSGALQFQVMFFTSVYMIVFTVINRYLPALLINVVMAGVLSYVNAEKFALRNEPLLVGDFSWITEISFFKDYINWGVAIPIIVGVVAIVAFLIWSRKRILPGKMSSWTVRGITLAVIFSLFTTTYISLKTEKDDKIVPNVPVISSVYNRFTKPWLGINASAKFQSLTFLWFKQITANLMDTPEGYSEEKIEELYEKYMEVSETINKDRSKSLSDQTIIYVLSESFADPSRINGVTVSENPIPNINKIKSQTTSGLMKSDGYGGGTANMEFQTLFGLPMYNFSNTISIMYNEVVPKMSYYPVISNHFEEQNRIVIHLNNANNYSRKSVYNSMGYETFVATSGGDEEPSDTGLFGNNYSDEATYNNVLDKLDNKTSQFFSVLTIQNHGPWGETDRTTISAEGKSFSENDNYRLTNYVKLLKETDESTQAFLDKLEEYEKDITVVFYGDHLPSLYPQSAFQGNEESQYLADYFIWSNHSNTKLDYPKVNSSDFSALMLAHTDSKVSGYYALLTEVLDKATVDKDELTKEEQVVADDLAMIQYDLTQGKKYITNYDDFFELD